MITGERILEISGFRSPEGAMKSLSININVDDVRQINDTLEVHYVYTADYEDKFGQVKIKGVMIAKEDENTTKEILETWKKTKKLPNSFSPMLLTVVNYSGSANGTFLARVLNLSAPLIPPVIRMDEEKK